MTEVVSVVVEPTREVVPLTHVTFDGATVDLGLIYSFEAEPVARIAYRTDDQTSPQGKPLPGIKMIILQAAARHYNIRDDDAQGAESVNVEGYTARYATDVFTENELEAVSFNARPGVW